MSLEQKILLWALALCLIFTYGFSIWSDKEKERLEAKRDSMITEHHRLQRELDWQYDSITTIFNRQLDTLIYKANKYDSIMEYEKKQRKPQLY